MAFAFSRKKNLKKNNSSKLISFFFQIMVHGCGRKLKKKIIILFQINCIFSAFKKISTAQYICIFTWLKLIRLSKLIYDDHFCFLKT